MEKHINSRFLITSSPKLLANFLRTSGAIRGTTLECSPINHSIAALAWATVMLSNKRAMWVTISLGPAAWVCRSLLITTTLSATTASKITTHYELHTENNYAFINSFKNQTNKNKTFTIKKSKCIYNSTILNQTLYEYV